MPDKNLTDNEIKKAFQMCTLKAEHPGFVLCGQIVDLINRLQADVENYKQVAENQQKVTLDRGFEIKRLKEKIERLQSISLRFLEEMRKWGNKNNIDTTNFSMIPILESENESLVKQIKAEAYKEFAERLHEELRMYGIKDKFDKAVFLNVVDKAKKELVGDSDV